MCPKFERDRAPESFLETEHDEIISIEDEIFNLALRPVRRLGYTTKRPNYSKIYRSTTQSVHTNLPINITKQIRNFTVNQNFVQDRLLSVVKKNLFLLDERVKLK